MKNYYEILETSPNADTQEIKKAYQRLALQHHPDKNSSEIARSIYLQIDEAWQILRDPDKRRIYDAELYEYKLNEQSNVFAELNIKTDLIESEVGILSYPCRCGDFYEISKDDVADEKEFMIECNQCSLVVLVRNNS